MRYAVRFFGLCIIFSMAVALSGCMSMAFESDLVPGTTPAPSVGTARFHIADVQVSTTVKSEVPQQGTKLFGTPKDLSSDAVSARPNLFSDDFTSWPIVLKVASEYDNSTKLVAFLCALTVGTIPVPCSEKTDYTVFITIPTMEGELNLGSVAFKRRDVMWVTLFTPLGLIPVPGTSVIPRECQTIANANGDYVARAQKLTNAVCVEAVAKVLGQCDAATLAKLQTLSEDRKSRLHSLSLDGKPCWGFLAFTYSNPNAQTGPMDVAILLLFTAPPTWEAIPSDKVTVARRGEDGRWRPCNGYPSMAQTLTAATVLLKNGKPDQVVLRPVEEPPLEDFIDLPDAAEKDRAKSIRWSNGVLLQVKNRSLPRVLNERSGAELLDLVTRMEKAVLALDQQAEQCKDSAQRMVEQGKGDPASAREMAILCQQRIVILKAILAALKQGAVRKP